MKSSKFTGKMEKIKAKWTQVSLKNVLKVKDPKLSRVLIVRNNGTLPCKVQKTTMKTEILPLNVVNDQLVIFCSQWMSFGQNLLQLVFRQICETCNLRVFSALFLLLVGWGPKRTMPTEKLGSSSLVSSIFQREGKLHCSLTGRKL